MKAKFKGPKKIDGTFYGKGEHTLPEAHAGHWFVKALIKSGDVVVLDEAKATAPIAEKAEKSEEKAQAPQPQGKSNKAK